MELESLGLVLLQEEEETPGMLANIRKAMERHMRRLSAN